MKKIFDVLIDGRTYDVLDIEGKEHEGWNDIPKTWWINFVPSEGKSEFPPLDSPDLVPFAAGIERIAWSFNIEQTNSSKPKWNNISFSNHIKCEVFANKKKVYEFYGRDVDHVLSQANILTTSLCEHSYNFLNTDSEKGKKIYFFGLPATIMPKEGREWEIMVYPDTEKMPKKEWWTKYRELQISMLSYPDEIERTEERIEQAMEDGQINWGDPLQSAGYIRWGRF